jgi:CheY-like chemotaxis protein
VIRGLGGMAGQVPVIALTAHAMPEDIAASRAAGMDGHLPKPLERTALLAELARVLPGR